MTDTIAVGPQALGIDLSSPSGFCASLGVLKLASAIEILGPVLAFSVLAPIASPGVPQC